MLFCSCKFSLYISDESMKVAFQTFTMPFQNWATGNKVLALVPFYTHPLFLFIVLCAGQTKVLYLYFFGITCCQVFILAVCAVLHILCKAPTSPSTVNSLCIHTKERKNLFPQFPLICYFFLPLDSLTP